MSPDTRPSLILRLGDPADDGAWSEFLQIYEPTLFQLASRWGLQDADAREVVQETLLAVANSIPKFKSAGRGAFRGWLATITRNKLADHLAKRAKQEHGSGDSKIHAWLDQQASETSNESIWDAQAKRMIFAWAADRVRGQVNAATWEVFYRTSICGEGVSEVSRDLGIREGMIYVARSRVMARLRKAVETWTQQEDA